MSVVCIEAGCPRPVINAARQMCNAHYLRWLKVTPKGERAKVKMGPDPALWEERIWKKVNKTGSCWLWAGPFDRAGYGRTSRAISSEKGSPRHATGAHRVVYQLVRGDIPEGKDLDHLCRVPACVNPAHLEVVSRRENVLRGVGISAVNAKKTHCKRGHEFSTENTYLRPPLGKRSASRVCRRCAASASKHRKRTKDTL